MSRLRKEDIARKLSKLDSGFTMPEATKYIDMVFSIIKQDLQDHVKVGIRDFGSWEIKYKNGRPGRAVRSGEEVWISPRHVVRFVPSKKLIEKINPKKNEPF